MNEASRSLEGVEPPLSGGRPQTPSFVAVMRRRWRLLIIFAACSVGLGSAYALWLPDYYEASNRFVAVGRIGSEGLGGIDQRLQGFARQLGAMQLFESADLTSLLPSFLRSRQVIDRVLDTPITDPQSGHETVLESLGLEFEDPKKLRNEARKLLRERLLVLHTNEESGVTTLIALHSDPEIAAKMANAAVQELQTMARSMFSSRAADESRFVSERLEEVAQRLRESEDELTEFKKRNRLGDQSPQLSREENRLSRRVLLNEQLFLTLRIQDELARLEEVKNTSVLWVLDHAEPPLEPAGPKRLLIALSALFAGLTLGTGFVLFRDYPILG